MDRNDTPEPEHTHKPQLSTQHDISPLIEGWEHDPTSVSSRYVKTQDGKKMVQMRLELGLFQMEIEGRPDGTEPHGHESLLDFHRRQLLTERRTGYKLAAEDCAELQQESVQYYYRYLALLALKDYPGVIRDTRHNLDIFEMVEKYADNEEHVWEFLQFKPYVFMMNTRAQAEMLAGEGRVDEALEAVKGGAREIRRFLEEQGEEVTEDNTPELTILADLARELLEGVENADSPVVRLKERLRQAVHLENYEEAARLRDEIKAMAPDEEAVCVD